MSEAEAASPESVVSPSPSPGPAGKIGVVFVIVAVLLAVMALRLWEQPIVDALVMRADITPGLRLWIVAHAFVFACCIVLLLAMARRRSKARTSFNGAMVLASGVAILAQAGGLASAVITHDDTRSTYEALALEENADLSMIEDGRMQIVGPIGPKFMDDFSSMRAGRLIATIEITSEGGLLDQALALARVIKDDNISVVVRSYCFSACVAIAVASHRSFADVDAVYGLHRSSPLGEAKSEVAQWNQQLAQRESRAFLKEHGVPEDFLQESDKNEGEEIFEVSARDMLDRGIIEGLVNGREIVAEGSTAVPRWPVRIDQERKQ